MNSLDRANNSGTEIVYYNNNNNNNPKKKNVWLNHGKN